MLQDYQIWVRRKIDTLKYYPTEKIGDKRLRSFEYVEALEPYRS
jgi:hypothetical protein